ncbi:MAG TPA: porin family protein [Paludibacteraceae bacterium]|nr:porin family protein [Paludibacteraceae bacterium]HPL94703.1 porin family protein [Paludibacteraceae bacterium]
MLKKLSLLLLLSLIVLHTTAQSDRGVVRNLQNVDLEPFHFGFILGLNYSDYTATPSNIVDTNQQIWYPASKGLSPGFTVGMLVDLRLFEYLNLRFTPTLGLGQRDLNFSAFSTTTDERIGNPTIINIKSTTVDLPLLIKYSAERVGNYRPYLLAGAGPTINLARSKADPILVKPFDVQAYIGFGCDMYLEYFKLCPELKFGFGLLDSLERNHPDMQGTSNQKFIDAISRLSSRMLVLTFNFE